MRAHLIKNGKIENTIEVDSLDFCDGLIDAEVGGTIGDEWDGQQIIKKPKSLTREEILVKLEEIDKKSIRALRESNQERIASLEAEAAALRVQLVQ